MFATTKDHLVPTKPANTRIIRDPEFARRLEKACDGNSLVPAKHMGRLTWIQRELKRQLDEDVSVETVRKWFAGEAKPRPDKLEKLAELLQVDVGWLSLGLDPTLQPREMRARNAMASGAVNLVAGLIQMDGGSVAFPDKPGTIDLHAIIRGGKYDLHVSVADIAGGNLKFAVPTDYEDAIVLGVVKRGFELEIFELPQEIIESGNRRGGSIEVTISEVEGKLRKIDSFQSRL